MEEKIFSKKLFLISVFILSTLVTIGSFLLDGELMPEFEPNEQRVLSAGLDLKLKNQLDQKVKQAISAYSVEGWKTTRMKLEEIEYDCRQQACEPEVFFSEFFDALANTLGNSRELIYAGSILGITYFNNWELADLDNDQENELIILQRDVLNSQYITLKVVDFQEKERIVREVLPLGYFSSPISHAYAAAPLRVLNLNKETAPEILLFLTGSRGGALLFVYSYSQGELNLIFREDDLAYPEYTFTDVDGDGVSEIIAQGHDPETKKSMKTMTKL